MNTEIEPAYTIAILAGKYLKITGDSLDMRILGFLYSAGYRHDEDEMYSILKAAPADIVASLAQKITEVMKSPEVRDRLIAQKSKDAPNIPADGDYEYLIEVDPEPAIEFVGVDPETQAEILKEMETQGDA